MKYTKDNPKLVENIYNFKGIKTFTGVVEDKKTIAYHVNGKYHREDGPAIEHSDGRKEYYVNDKLHREDGPACESINYKEWWLNDNHYGDDDDFTNESWIRFVQLQLLK